jgi:ribose 5-phosphate isomerase B
MKIAIGFDHAGVPLRETVTETLAAEGHELIDCGTADDYPDIVIPVCRAIVDGGAERGVLVCGSGAGVGVAASKIDGIRAQTTDDTYTAHQSVEHDDLNVLCLGARVVGPELAADLIRAWARASFSGEERHKRRLAKVSAIERDGLAADLGDITG